MPPRRGARSAELDCDTTRVLVCGDFRPAENDALSCRLNAGRLTLPATWDEERHALCCLVPASDASLIGPGLKCEVVDAQGRIRSCDKPQDVQSEAPAVQPAPATATVMSGLGWLDRLLPVWIVAAMVLGVLLGYLVPAVRSGLAVLEIGGVSLPIALGLWAMMLPVLAKVRYELLAQLLNRSTAKQFAVSAALNWLVGPALMTGLAWACLPDLPGYRNGVIMVGLARCIAMVLIWNAMAQGDSEMCAMLVAVNSVLQILLYSPLSIFYLQVVSGSAAVTVGFWPVAKSVLLFLGVPLLAGIVLRYSLLALTSRRWFDERFMPLFGPLALLGLLYTIVVMFAAQGDQIIGQIGSVARVALPMLAYFILMFTLSFLISWAVRMPYSLATTQAFTAASNNFELAIAVAVGTFGIQSQEALAATVGPLIEVPALLSLVYVSFALKRRFWDARQPEPTPLCAPRGDASGDA